MSLICIVALALGGCQRLSKVVFSEMHEEKDFLGDITKVNLKVEEAQVILTGLKFYRGSIDGVLGKRTRASIKQFQEESGIMVTGFIGKKTWGKLRERKSEIKVQNIEKPLSIEQIQYALKKAGYDPGPIDGKLGWKTQEAVKKFQKTRGLKIDGIAGKNTVKILREYL